MTVAARIADDSCSLEAIILIVEVLLMFSSGPVPKHSTAAELGKPSGPKLALLPLDSQSCQHTGWSRKGRRQCIQRVQSKKLVRIPRD